MEEPGRERPFTALKSYFKEQDIEFHDYDDLLQTELFFNENDVHMVIVIDHEEEIGITLVLCDRFPDQCEAFAASLASLTDDRVSLNEDKQLVWMAFLESGMLDSLEGVDEALEWMAVETFLFHALFGRFLEEGTNIDIGSTMGFGRDYEMGYA